MAKRMMMDEEMMANHIKWQGGKMLILGLLILANVYWPTVDWFTFAGIILVFAGVMKLATPAPCGCHR